MKKIPFYPQNNEYYCGPATLQMTLAAFGIKASQQTLAKTARTNSKKGTSVLNMIRTLRSYTLHVQAGNLSTLGQIKKFLKKEGVVIVCYTEPVLEWGHYIIVETVTETRVRLIDSDAPTGRTLLPLQEFKRRWRDPLFTKTIRWAAFVQKPKSPRTES